MIVRLFMCCEATAIDVRGGLCAFFIISDIYTVVFPFVLPKLSVIFLSLKEPADPEELHFNLRISLGDLELHNSPIAISFGGQNRGRFVAELQGVLLPAAGELVAAVRDGDREIAAWKMIVQRVVNPAPAENAAAGAAGTATP
jgi:hypothetical protein